MPLSAAKKGRLDLEDTDPKEKRKPSRRWVAKAPKPTPEKPATTDKAIVKGKASDKDRAKTKHEYPGLEKAGIRILDKAIHLPVQRRMVQVGGRYYPEAGAILRGAKVQPEPWANVDPYAYSYEGMDKYYREFRRDSLVRSAIIALAFYSTNKGFDTVLEPVAEMTNEEAAAFVDTPQYKNLKTEIDQANLKVKADNAWNIAVINKKIYGCAAFEKVRESRLSAGYIRHALFKGQITRRVISFLPLESRYIRPHLDNDWNLVGYDYYGKENYYGPDEVLYFPNLALSGDMVGISSIEPILGALESRRVILDEALPEAATALWAGTAYVQVDTTGKNDADAEAEIEAVAAAWTPGRVNFGNHRVSATIVDLNPDLMKLVGVVTYLDNEIIGNFQVPRFLIARESGASNYSRATAYAEVETFVNGPVAQEQRDLRRVIEAEWYDQLVREILHTPQGQDPLIRVKHKWKPISTADFATLLTALSQAAGPGWMPPQKAYELAGFDPTELLQRYAPVVVTKKPPVPGQPQQPGTGVQPTPVAGQTFTCDCCGVTLKNPARPVLIGDKTAMVGPECSSHPNLFPCDHYRNPGKSTSSA